MKARTIVITGASSGIGAALAQSLGNQGHRLVLAARREKELQQVALAAGNGAIAVVTDVTQRAEVERLRDKAIEQCGHVDVWINNAGRGISRKVMDLTDDDVDQILAVNFKSALYGMQAIVPHFQQRGEGHLINVSSFLGRVPLVAFRSAYSAAKAALNVITANLRIDLREQFPNIHVSLVMPGVVTTDFGRNALGGSPGSIPTGSAAGHQTAEEVAAVIASLIEEPKAEVYTNPALSQDAVRYYTDVAAFESNSVRR